MNLKELAEKLNLSYEGDGNLKINQIKDTERLKDSTFIVDGSIYYVASKKYLKKHLYLKNNNQIVILSTESLKNEFANVIFAEDKKTHLKFIELLKLFEPEIPKPDSKTQSLIHPNTKIGKNTKIYPGAIVMENALIGDNVTIYPGCVVESFAKIGEYSILHPNSVIGHHCILGKGNIIYGGAVIGADGFGYHDQDGKRYKVPQIGNVILEDYVEIGASSTIDRATIESTIVRENTKIDDQCHFGHNGVMGKNVYVAGNVGIAGSVTVEDGAILGGMVGIADHVTIKENTFLMGLTGVPSDLEGNQVYFGIPARPVRKMHRINSILNKLPDIYDTLLKMVEEHQNSKEK